MKHLDSLSGTKAFFIHAPAGFGKTTSAYLWLKHREKSATVRYAWISLEERDNVAASFCQRFISALSQLQPENDSLRDLIFHPVFGTAPMKFVQYALGVFGADEEPCLFVFDNLHVINNAEILAVWPQWLDNLPKNCSSLLMSRAAPPDTLAEWVLKDALAVVDAKQLSFSIEEIKTFFISNGRTLTGKKAADIHAATGGWAIALRAMVLTEEASYNIDLTGQYLEHFLRTHVWERWDERTKQFLLLVAVVTELYPELCRELLDGVALMEATDCPAELGRLARENTFLRAVGPHTYRFLDLFREFLLRVLQEDPDRYRTQMAKAGDHYFGKGEYYKAVEHYLAAGNDDGVAKSLYLMYDYNSNFASIEDTLDIIHKAISEPLLEAYPFLLEVKAWAAFVEGRGQDFEDCLDKYYRIFPKLVLSNPRMVITGALLKCIDYRLDCIPLMKQLRRIPLKGLVDIRAFTPSISNNLPHFHRSVRDFSELAGEAEENISWLEKGVGAIIGPEWAVIKECLAAGFLYEKGELGVASERAFMACGHISAACSAEIKFCAMMILAAIHQASGLEQDTKDVLTGIKQMMAEDAAFYLEANLKAFLCRIKLADGDAGAAKAWLREHEEQNGDKPPIYLSYQYATTARAHIVMGEYAKAILLLKKLLILGECYRRPLDEIEYRILLAIAYWKRGRGGHQTAIDYIEEAAYIAQTYGYIQAFANEGADLVSMLSRLHKRAVQITQGGRVSGTFVKTLYVAAFTAAQHSKGFSGGRVAKNLSFTQKQQTVMRLMCEGYAKNAIAEEMGLKPSGVKTHMELIYNKLGVGNSVEAIMKIKGLGLLAECE